MTLTKSPWAAVAAHVIVHAQCETRGPEGHVARVHPALKEGAEACRNRQECMQERASCFGVAMHHTIFFRSSLASST